MLDLILSILIALAISAPVTILLGVLYFFIASFIVNSFNLNRGEKNWGYHFFNGALLATFVSFFVIFSFILRIK